MEELSEGDRLMSAAHDAAHDFSQACRRTRAANPFPEVEVLPMMINTLMTELWDRCFSQTEIRQAFEEALADMNRYAAGDERRP